MAKKVKEESWLQFGPTLTDAATSLGKTPEELALDMLYTPHTMELQTGNITDVVTFMPGNDCEGNLGPNTARRTDVMVIGRAPWRCDALKGRIFGEETGKVIYDVLNDLDVDYAGWYLTNLVKFVPPRSAKTLKAGWIKECKPLLNIELDVIKPKFILLLGTDAIKAVMGKGMSLKKLRGADDLMYRDARVMVTAHPASVIVSPEQHPSFVRDLEAFVAMVKGAEVERMPTVYEDIIAIPRLKEVVAEFIQKLDDATTPEECRIALDAEWGSNTKSNYLNGKMRTIQISNKVGTGYCLVLRRQGLIIDENCCDETEAMEVMRSLLCHPKARLGGHNLREDLKWIRQAGVDCEANFVMDTMTAYHLGFDTAEGVALERLAVRFTDLGRYDLKVKNWLSANGYGADDDKQDKLCKYGYRDVPDLILHPYACADVDVVIRSWPIIEDKLRTERVTRPYTLFAGESVETLWDVYTGIVHPCNIPLQEIETVGVAGDEDRLVRLTELFVSRLDTLVTVFRDDIKWPKFNFRSIDQAREFLFGQSFGKKRTRPEDAYTANLTPVKTTEKPSRDWSKVRPDDIEKNLVSPSTDAESLLILGSSDKFVKQFQRLRYVDQVVKNFLRPPDINKETGALEWNGGLMYELDADKRVRTSLSQISDTGRYRSSNPNLQHREVVKSFELLETLNT